MKFPESIFVLNQYIESQITSFIESINLDMIKKWEKLLFNDFKI